MQTRISDLLDIIHLAIIKNSPSKENDIIINELQSINEKIKNGLLPNYSVDDIRFFKYIINNYI
jgi:hypothetical protein